MKNIVGLFLIITLGFGQTAEDIAGKTEARLRSYQSLQANFEQLYFSSAISNPLRERGKVFLKKPGWMKWEYLNPEKKTFLLKGELYQAYYPEDNQLVQQTLSDEKNEAEILSLLSGRRPLLEHYTVELSPFPTESTQVHQLKLTPVGEEADTFILLEIQDKTWLIQKAIFFDWAGNKQEFHFSQMKTNVPLSDEIFELHVPLDVEIIK
jgi:outer membrane lipoprotein carrier protein